MQICHNVSNNNDFVLSYFQNSHNIEVFREEVDKATLVNVENYQLSATKKMIIHIAQFLLKERKQKFITKKLCRELFHSGFRFNKQKRIKGLFLSLMEVLQKL